MKTKPSTISVLGLTVALALLIPALTEAASKVTFDNQSGKPALVKLVGPTASFVTVENSKKESVSVAPGHYFIKVRYGTPGAYTYSKGDEFDVAETSTSVSAITITLHKVVAGNYGSKSISESEFGAEDGKEESAEHPHSAEKIEGAFGFRLGDLFDPANANRTNFVYSTLDGERIEYQVTVKQANKAFDTYFVEITPKTRRIYRIVAKGGDLTQTERRELENVLRGKYETRTDKGAAQSAWLTKIIDQGNRYIGLTAKSQGSVYVNVPPTRTTELSYTDDALAELAVKEAAQKKFEGKSGL